MNRYTSRAPKSSHGLHLRSRFKGAAEILANPIEFFERHHHPLVKGHSIYFPFRTRLGHSGATTSRTPKDSSSSLTAMTGTCVESHFRFLTIFRSQGKSRRGTRRADEDARRGRAEGGGEYQHSPPLVQHQPPYYDFRCC